MAKDPAFLFYPGDYLRDTQCLSDKAQVAYDRIMCEHMRNISLDMTNITVSQERVNFFIKRLSDDERDEIYHVLKKEGDAFQIEWVAESISKRRSYSESRAKNRSKKDTKDMKTYDNHMEDEIENVFIENSSIVYKMFEIFKKINSEYPEDKKNDSTALFSIASKISKKKNILQHEMLNGKMNDILKEWEEIVLFTSSDKWFSTRSISDINNEWQRLSQSMNNKGRVTNDTVVKKNKNSYI